MIKAARLTLHHDSFTDLSCLDSLEKCVQKFYPHRNGAGGARRQLSRINRASGQRHLAFGTWDYQGCHLLSHADDAGIGNVIVQGSLLAVERGNNVADVADHPAENLRHRATEGPAISDRGSFRCDHLEATSHFPGSGAIFAMKECRISGKNYEVAELCQNSDQLECHHPGRRLAPGGVAQPGKEPC